MEKELDTLESDFSLIINTADSSTSKSYEYSSTLGMKNYFPPKDTNFVSTNFYLSPAWENTPAPTDSTTWMGITRRNNLLNLSNSDELFNITNFEALMDRTLSDGGAKWDLTIYQMIFDPKNLDLYLKIKGQNNWTQIPLKTFFNSDSL